MKHILKNFGFALLLTFTLTSAALAQNPTTPNAPTTRPEIVPEEFTVGTDEYLYITNAAG